MYNKYINNQTLEFIRYAINGLIATVVHFFVLSININVLNYKSAGLANLVASIFGITSSFIGNRYFVFKRINTTVIKQLINFSGLYGIIAILNCIVLYIWTDKMGFEYTYGFIIATTLQVLLSYIGNKKLVFMK